MAVFASVSVQDRTDEFRSILSHQQKRQASSAKAASQRRQLLTDSQRAEANADADPTTAAGPRRSEFARQALIIGRGIEAAMAKLQKLTTLTRRRTLFDDPTVEINELIFIIKKDLNGLNHRISELQTYSTQQHSRKNHSPPSQSAADQEGEHQKSVVVLLQGKLTDVVYQLQGCLEERTKSIQASRSRTDQFISSVSQHAQPSSLLLPSASASPLYGGTPTGGSTPDPSTDVLSLRPATDQQLLLMEEAQQNSQSAYITQRGDAIETIERTISELGEIFGQLASMVAAQGDMIERIDANTDDVVDNVAGAHKELVKYWSRVSSNRWLIAKMFGVLMIFFLLWVLVAG